MKLVCVAMEKECDYLIKFLSLEKIAENIYKNNDILLVLTGIGKVNATMWTQYAICNYNIYTIYNYGFVGSMTDKLKCGDFVSPCKVLQHDFDLTCDGFKIGEVQGQTVSYIPTSKEILEKAKQLIDIKEADYLLSGDRFMTERLEGFGDSICDMEGYGVARVANNANIPYFMLKLVTDSCNKEGQEEYYKSIDLYKKKMQEIVAKLIGNNL